MLPLLRLYPARWRQRYGPELRLLLEDEPPGLRARIGLVGGALDAHLHPWWVPAWPVLAAGIGGVAWTFAGMVALGQPVPPDWPGYLAETLPVHLAAAPLLALATLGVSTRLGPWDPAAVRVARPLAVIAWVAWIVLLGAALAGAIGAGPVVAAASTAVALATLLLGVALLRAADGAVGGGLLLAGLALVVPAPWSAAVFGVAWVLVAIAQLLDPRPQSTSTRRAA